MPARHNWRGPEVLRKLHEAARKLVAASAVVLQDEIRRQLGRGSSPSAPGSPPGVLTGFLRRSIEIDLSRIGEPHPKARVGSTAPYAAIHEFGGVVTPKTAGALAVPIGIAGRRAARDAGGSIRSLNLQAIKRPGRPTLLVRPGPRKSMVPLFVLKQSITLPPRPYIRPAVALARPRIVERFRGVFNVPA